MSSTNLVSGLSSGFDWRSMIDQLIEIEHKRVDIVEDRKSDYQAKLSAFQSVNTMLLSLKTQSVTLAKSDSFNVYTSSLTTDSANYNASDFMSVTIGADAAPGSHTIEMTTSSSIAHARKISSRSFASYDEALVLTGEFVINGRAVRVDDTDDLMDIRGKINNVNSGSNATGVTASILTVSDTDYRLILTSDNTGEDAFNIFDASADTVNILQNTSIGLGFLDSTTPTIKNSTSDGAESGRFSSSEVAVGSLLGLTSAQTGAVTIGGSAVNINLAADSLTVIAGKIDAVGGVSASVESVTEDGTTSYYIDINGTTSFSDDNNVLQTLGILSGGQSDVAEVHLSDTANTAVSTGLAITGSICFDDITGYTAATGDTITISGTKHDGTAITTTDFNVYDAAYKDVDALLDEIETLFFGELTGTATITDGKIQVTDNTAGDSQLSISLTCNNEGGGILDLGTLTAATQGYTMQTAEGRDSSVKIDGTTITSSTNVITDVISGITINLKKIESGSQVDLNVSRDLNGIKSSVQGFTDKYNEVLEYINGQFAWDEDTESAGLLSGDGTLSSIKSSLQNIVISTIKDLPTDMNALSLIGINSDMDGVLSLNDSDFTDALVNDFAGVRRIFVAEGTTTDGDISYISHAGETVAGDYAVKITTAAEQALITGVTDLSGGIASGETMVITQGSSTATIAINTGSAIDDIVNAVNSELDTVYTELWTATKANTRVGGGVITSSTVWEDIDTEGGSNLVTNGDTISFSGETRSGTSISGTYTIEDKTTDTVQGLLSAIEDAYGNNISANIDSNGKLILTDNTAGSSQLEISLTCNKEGGGSLDFGTMEVTTEGRYAIAVTASKDVSNQLVLESDDYGSSVSFTAKQYATVSGAEEITGDVVNTSSAVNITGATVFDVIDGYTAGDQDKIKINGVKHDGTVIDEVVFDVYDGVAFAYKDVDAFLAEIGTALDGTASVVDGKIKLTDNTTGASLMTLTLTADIVNGSGTLDFGTVSASTGIINGSDSGVDVAGTINGEAATGSGRTLTGDAPAEDETTSVEGLSVKVTLTSAQLTSQGEDQGNVKITMGAAELFDRELYGITDLYDGYVAFKQTSLQNSIDSFETQIENMEASLNRKMETLINRFVSMEMALSKIQTQSEWLAGQISASFSGWKGF